MLVIDYSLEVGCWDLEFLLHHHTTGANQIKFSHGKYGSDFKAHVKNIELPVTFRTVSASVCPAIAMNPKA